MNELPNKPHLRVSDIARFLDLSPSQVYRLIDEGVLPSIRIDGAIRVPRETFLKWHEKRLREDENKLSA